jgi:Beta-galactosidase
MTSFMRVVTTFSNLVLWLLIAAALMASAAEMPKLVNKNGHFAFDVEGRPYLILGAQIHNSSAWPSVLPKVWPALEAMHANTAAAPVYWEQMEANPGQFDFGTVDLLVKQAREHNLHLILLWFGTWKNGNMHYVPTWVKTDTARFPRMVNAHGEPLDVLSAHAPANLNADKNAFVHFMRHLKELDGETHTVLMIQVENESGAIGTVRDFSPMAERQFESAVPTEMKTAGKSASGTWRQVFGGEADEYFQAYSRRVISMRSPRPVKPSSRCRCMSMSGWLIQSPSCRSASTPSQDKVTRVEEPSRR